MGRVKKQAGVTRAEAAAALGVQPARINRWVADGAPVVRAGKRGLPAYYDIEALREWRQARDDQRQADGLSLEQERTLLTREQREKYALENAVRRGELLPRDEVIQDGQMFVKGLQAQVRAIPRRARHAGVISSQKQESELVGLCRQVLLDISGWKTAADVKRAVKAADAA